MKREQNTKNGDLNNVSTDYQSQFVTECDCKTKRQQKRDAAHERANLVGSLLALIARQI